jgi:hypothetical protein
VVQLFPAAHSHIDRSRYSVSGLALQGNPRPSIKDAAIPYFPFAADVRVLFPLALFTFAFRFQQQPEIELYSPVSLMSTPRVNIFIS